MKVLAAALVILLSLQDKVELRWKWTKGQEVVYKSTQKTVFELAGQAMEQHMGYTYSMTVADVAESGEATLTVKYLSVATRGSGPTGEFDYDSEKDKEAPTEGPAAMQAKMVGQSFTMKLNPVGRVTAVQGYDKVLEAMMKGAPDDNPQMRMQLKQMFNDDSFKGMMQQMFPPLPEEKVGKDDTWAAEFIVKVPMLGGMTFSQKSKVTDLKESNVNFDQDLKVELKGGDKDNPFAGFAEIKEAKGKATAVFSTSKNCIVSQKATVEMKISVQGNEMPMKTLVEMKLVSKK